MTNPSILTPRCTYPRILGTPRARVPVCALLLTALAVAVHADSGPADGARAGAAAADLALTRVAIFSSGVAYYQADATVEGSATAELTFRKQQINDILKSLIVSDLDGGSVGAVSYASQDPVDKALRSFGVDITGKPSLAALLDQLRGEPVSIGGPRELKGIVLGVEKQKVPAGQTSIDVEVLNVLADTGVQQLPIRELQDVKFTNPKIDAELRRALATLADSHDADKKSVQVQFNGQGKRRVRLAYLLEAPLWKCSYRLALRDPNTALLQGWATVENATEDDWKNVKLSLVSGRPISFVMDLYSPLYVPRPKVELEIFAGLRPPEYAGDTTEKAKSAGGRAQAPGSPAPAAAAEGFAGPRNRRAVGQAEGGTLHQMQMSMDEDAAGAVLMRLGEGVASVSDAREAGELFVYDIKQPVTIARQHSAMLPIVDAQLQVEKLSIYNPQTHARYPLNGLQLTNASGLHLMQGPVTLFDADVYAGEAKLPDLKPGEQRLVAYALDLGCEVRSEDTDVPLELVSARVSKGVFFRQHRLSQVQTYFVKNKTDADKTVVLEHAYSSEWELLEPKQADEKTDRVLRFKLRVKAGETVTRKVHLSQVVEEQAGFAQLQTPWIVEFCANAKISEALKAALQKIVALRAAHEEATRIRVAREGELAAAIADQDRVRKNVETLDKSTDAYKRQLKKFDDLETQIEGLRKQVAEAKGVEEQRRREVEQYLMGLEVN